MGRPRLKMLAPTLLVLLVASGMQLMHGFESVSAEPLATHAVHDVDVADATAIVAGICVFVIAMLLAISRCPPPSRWPSGRKPDPGRPGDQWGGNLLGLSPTSWA